ncbi:glycosyltransferase [Pedobacter sp. Leaf194]|uniref:glycosyltransferase family 2 protein n=1 Tax=Pedobacter sp. Leaf194 TaxID=1736297 RepID=UPI000703912B|nr:glycosyltransferase [Pedobacter sp. Leaf194]KQS37795.1 hypothetical protein ASG14_19780 [Pedobacter sp. Leaf194]
MNLKPTFSILTPTYNCAKYILSSWQTLCLQTETNWEWVIVNDGSTDDSLEILNSLKDERIRIHTYDDNRGRGFARNLALSKASGDIIVIWDIDDLYFPDRLEKIKNAFLNKDIEYFCSYALIVDNQLKIKGVRRFPSDIVFNKSFVHPTLAFRSSLLGSLKYGEGVAGEDFELMVFLEKKCKGFFCEEFLMLYLEDREINLYKTLHFHKSFVQSSKRLIQENVLRLTPLSKLKFYATAYLKTIILHLMKIKPSLYLKTVKFRHLELLNFDELPQYRKNFINSLKK